ncbi:MAG: hypothetical protein AVDCRST_MAG41-2038 [uncultured Corynebacteriales bacterium]|uniref:Uncharacterized protein n=1 Tax=uncultured Mycobacteriales bacterium TaxID=581187 RepID=A0A6J4IH57_9ACTN|nr:MAG: hypothetical protein AVDCRST_MAG41-2038 [uncultured Corynebacteriales bacterium]
MRMTREFVDHRGEVLDLAFECVWRGVTTVSAAASRVIGHREEVDQRRDERRILRPVIEASADQHHRRPVAATGVGDRGSVLRLQVVHGASSRCRSTTFKLLGGSDSGSGSGCGTPTLSLSQGCGVRVAPVSLCPSARWAGASSPPATAPSSRTPAATSNAAL